MGFRSITSSATPFLSTPSARRATGEPCARSSSFWHFYPRPPRGGRRKLLWSGTSNMKNFYPRPPRGGRLMLYFLISHLIVDFYPRPPRGGRRTPDEFKAAIIEFLSTPSARRATRAVMETAQAIKNFYPRPPRGGRPRNAKLEKQSSAFLSTPSARRATCAGLSRPAGFAISIHALREEGDHEMKCQYAEMQKISIHALREEGDRPARRRRISLPCISIHALREEGDFGSMVGGLPAGDFYPRPSRGGRPGGAGVLPHAKRISIHALREEGDFLDSRAGMKLSYFYPRPPRGGRPAWMDATSWWSAFLSTPSARRATCTHTIIT